MSNLSKKSEMRSQGATRSFDLHGRTALSVKNDGSSTHNKTRNNACDAEFRLRAYCLGVGFRAKPEGIESGASYANEAYMQFSLRHSLLTPRPPLTQCYHGHLHGASSGVPED